MACEPNARSVRSRVRIGGTALIAVAVLVWAGFMVSRISLRLAQSGKAEAADAAVPVEQPPECPRALTAALETYCAQQASCGSTLYACPCGAWFYMGYGCPNSWWRQDGPGRKIVDFGYAQDALGVRVVFAQVDRAWRVESAQEVRIGP
ncbi:MAG TPA: hypothetical protein VKN99_24760 [Polyangia bacterium]|nr:hypothetical protein [Polyangia bacterium]